MAIQIEQLEGRVLLAGNPLGVEKVSYLGGTQLKITGTAAADAISVGRTSTGVLIKNGVEWSRRISGTFKSLLIDGGAGKDSIRVDGAILQEAIVHGGAGDDVIFGGGGNDKLYGGDGRDRIDGGGGNDVIVMIGGGTGDTAIGGTGKDSFWVDPTDKPSAASGEAVHRVDAFLSTATGKSGALQTVSKEALGQKLTDPMLTSSELSYTNFSCHPLFSEAGPAADDVVQGGVGDCYFLSVLSSIAKVNPSAIRERIIEMGDGTYAVAFHKDGKPQFVRVDADLPTYSWGQLAYADTGAQGALWVAIMEKAFTYFRKGAGTYGSIEAGWMSEAYAAMGSTSSAHYSSPSASWLIKTIQADLAAGKSVTYAADEPAGAPLIGSHAYTVVSVVKNSKGQITGLKLRNPWGIDGAGDDGCDDGYVKITLAQAQGSFMGLASAWV